MILHNCPILRAHDITDDEFSINHHFSYISEEVQNFGRAIEMIQASVLISVAHDEIGAMAAALQCRNVSVMGGLYKTFTSCSCFSSGVTTDMV